MSDATDDRERIRAAWADVESRQRRAAVEWAEANRYFTEQTELLDARAADLAAREQATAARLARAEAEAAGLCEEAAGLEQRVQNARAVLADLERRRDLARAELLGSALPEGLIATAPDDFAQRELLLEREKAAVAALRSALERESADLDDRRRLAAEQLAQLADARVRWQRAERQTVIEMEELARALRRKDQELDAREQRVIRADARRREEAHDLWRLRLRLEAWQTKLTAFELRWHTEREELEADIGRRVAAVARRESALAATFARWERARAADHAQLRAELGYWAEDRRRLERAAADFDQRRQALLAEAKLYAARALAAEQLVGEAIQDAGSDRIVRRLRVLRTRWERVFDRKVRAVEAVRSEVAAERAAVEERYRLLHDRLEAAAEREASAADWQTATELAALAAAGGELAAVVRERRDVASAPSAELAALRDEVERLAAVVLEVELPEPPDPPELQIPWAVEEVEAPPDVLPFGADEVRAA